MPKIPRQVGITILITIFLISLTIMPYNFWLGALLIVLAIAIPAAVIGYVYYWGQALAVRGHIQEAITHYTRLLSLPFVPKMMVYTRRAGLRNAIGDVDGALEDYSAAIEKSNREHPTLYGVRSALYLGKREFQKALDDTNRLLTLRPRSEMGYANRAAAKMYLGDVEGAIADCNEGLNLSQLSASGKALLHNNRGTAYRMQGEYTKAMSDYNLAASTQLNEQQKTMIRPAVLTNQGIVYYLKEEYDQARAYFQQATGVNPNFLKATAGLAVARFKMDQTDKAKQLWQDLIQKERRYKDATWLQNELNWPMTMMTDAADLIEAL